MGFLYFIKIPIGIKNSAEGLNICAITAGIKKYKLLIKKTRKRYYKIVLLAKIKLPSIEVLISRALIDTFISHDEFLSVNNMIRG